MKKKKKNFDTPLYACVVLVFEKSVNVDTAWHSDSALESWILFNHVPLMPSSTQTRNLGLAKDFYIFIGCHCLYLLLVGHFSGDFCSILVADKCQLCCMYSGPLLLFFAWHANKKLMTKSNYPCLLFLLVFTQWKAVNVDAVTFSCLTEASEVPRYFLYNLSVTGCTLRHFWKLSEKQKWTTGIWGSSALCLQYLWGNQPLCSRTLCI